MYMCVPPRGTVVINKLEQPSVVKELGNRTYFLASEVIKEKEKNSVLFNKLSAFVKTGKVYVTSAKNPIVICGTLGELYTISLEELRLGYKFTSNGQFCTAEALATSGKMKKGLLDWVAIQSVSDNVKYWACFVPLNEKTTITTKFGVTMLVNDPMVSHGKGDFIIARDNMGAPNLADVTVVNGNVFATTYNNTGWSNCLNLANITLNTTKPTFDLCELSKLTQEVGIDPTLFRDKCSKLLNNLQNIFKFNVYASEYVKIKPDKTDKTIAQSTDFVMLARFKVKGNFSLQQSNNDSENAMTVLASETLITFSMPTNVQNAAILMTIVPLIENWVNYLQSYYFPTLCVSKCIGDINIVLCKEGTINNINCAESVKNFSSNTEKPNLYAFIDDRLSHKPVVQLVNTITGMLRKGEVILLNNKFNYTYNDKHTTVKFKDSSVIVRVSDNSEKNLFEIALNLDGVKDGKYVKYETYPYEDILKVVQVVCSFIGIQKRWYKNSFSNPPATMYVLSALESYSGTEFYDMNTNMSKDSLRDLSFENFFNVIGLMDYLDKCRTRGITLFRRMDTEKPMSEGDFIECNRFTSTSIVCAATSGFGEALFIFKDVDVHAAYINDLSHFRDEEFEVLVNAGYKIVVTRVVEPGKIYECEFVYTGKAINREYKNISQVNTVLYPKLLRSDIILSNFRIKCNEDTNRVVYNLSSKMYSNKIEVVATIKDDTYALVIKDNKMTDVYSNTFDSLDSCSDAMINFLVHYVQTELKYTKFEVSKRLYSMFSAIIYSMVSLFQQNGYVINGTMFLKDYEVKDTCTGRININGDNDDNFNINLRLDAGNKLFVSAKAENVKLKQVYDVSNTDISAICSGVLSGVETTFKLDQTRRLNMAESLACTYLDLKSNLLSKHVNSGLVTLTYDVEKKNNLVLQQNSGYICVGKNNFDYYANLRTIASAIVQCINLL